MGEINLNLGNAEKASELFDAAITQASKDAVDRISSMAERVANIYMAIDPIKSEMFLRKALNIKKPNIFRKKICA